MTIYNMNDRFWDDVAPMLRATLGLRPLTQKDAAKAYADAQEVEITEDEIDFLLEAARSEIPKERPINVEPRESQLTAIDDDVYQLHRNEGDEDDEVDKLLDQQRREALDDDDETEASES